MIGVAGGDDLVPISLVALQVFCPRRAWLEAVGETTDTRQMAVGVQAHAPSDDLTTSRSRVLRAVEVTSQRVGVVGRCDMVEVGPDERVTVVEFKSTPVRRRAEVTKPMQVQVILQSEALTDMGFEVAGAHVYFTGHHVRVPVAMDAQSRQRAVQDVVATRELIRQATAPPPLEDDARCTRCSHAGVCLPDERTLGPVHRRVLVADPDSEVLHLSTPGARAFTRSGRVRVEKARELIGSLPIERVLAVVVHGNIDLSSGLIRELLWRRAPIIWCSGSGHVVGWAATGRSPNGGPRARQHVLSQQGHLPLAREFVAAKICNQATMLRRHGASRNVVEALRTLQRTALRATSNPELFGIEGEAASLYFEHFQGLLTPTVRGYEGVAFIGRTRRPARDPLNSALNLAYGLLLADAIRALMTCGLDPHAGFLHSSQRNKPALALDLSEEFRTPVSESCVIGAFNNGELVRNDFSTVLGDCRLRDRGRRALIAAYERRVTTQFKHPIFGYRVTWRRAMEVQARLILGVIDGTQPTYKGIATR